MIAAQDGIGAQGAVPQRLIRAFLDQPQALRAALRAAGLAPHELALWARQTGAGPEIETQAGWLSVGQRPGHYKPLLELAASHLRAEELPEALPLFRWAYQAWQCAQVRGPGHRHDGAKLLALWGQCLHRLGYADDARERWLWALAVVPDADTLIRLARTIEAAGAEEERRAIVQEALRRGLPGSTDLARRLRHGEVPTSLCPPPTQGAGEETQAPAQKAASQEHWLAVMADVANLDLVCSDQFGPGCRLDYGRLLAAAGELGPVRAQVAFVPDVPETLAVRQHLAEASFEIDLKQPKRSRGRIVADTDAAMAATAVRWAGEPGTGRIEMWTGDGDLLKVREVVAQAWPQVTVAFRSFPVGTAASIRRLGEDWLPIGPEYLLA